MARAIPQVLGRIVWPLMVLTLVSLAVYISSGRLAMKALSSAQPEIAELLSSLAQQEVSIGGIRGEMSGFSPQIQIEDFAIQDESSGEWLNLPAVLIRLDAWASLLAGALRFDEVILQKPVFWSPPFSSNQEQNFPRGIKNFLSGFERIVIREGRFLENSKAHDSSLLTQSVRLDLDMFREGSQRDLKISIHSDSGVVFTAEGSGTGDPLDLKRFSGDFHGYVTGGGVALAAQAMGIELIAEGKANFWLSVSEGQTRVTLQADLENISQSHSNQRFLEGLSFSAALDSVSDRPQLWIQNATLTHAGTALALPRIQFAKLEDGWRFLARGLEVSPLKDIVLASGLLPDKASKIIRILDPAGYIEAISLNIASLEQPLRSWEASIVVADATTQPYRNVPGLLGIDASVTANQEGAQAWILTKDFTLDLPRVYESPIRFESVTGVLSGRWQTDALFLEDGVLLATASDHSAIVQFEIDIPLFKTASIERNMRLAASVTDAPISVRDVYIPYRLPPAAYRWLQKALPSGHIEAAAFLWFGGFKPYGDASQSMQLAANLRDITLAYQNDWPDVLQARSFLRLDNTLIDVWSPQTSIAGLELSDTIIGLRLRSDSSWLSIQSQSDSGVATLKNGLNALPSLSFVRPLLNDLTATGAASTDLNIGFDLRDIAGSLEVEVGAQLTSVNLDSALLDLSAEEISGALSYHYLRGFESSDLHGTLLGRRLAVEMGPQFATTPDTILAARLNVDVDVGDILEWRAAPISLPIDGIAPLDISVTVTDDIAVQIESDLKGVQVDLPLPWGKNRESAAPLSLTWSDRGWADWEMFWFGRFSAVVDTLESGSATFAIDVTPRTRPAYQSRVGNGAGIRIIGMLPELNLDEWLGFAPDGAVDGVLFPPIQVEDFRVEQLVWRGKSLGSLALSATSERESLHADFVLPWLRGRYQQQVAAPVSEAAAEFDAALEQWLSIEYVDINGLPDFGDRSAGEVTEFTSAWQPLPVTINNVFRGGDRLGDIDFTIAELQAKSWRVTAVTGDLAGVTFSPSSEMNWQIAGGEEVTSLSLAAQFSNLETSLNSLGVEPIVQTRSGSLDIDWSWVGSPNDFDLRAISGSMDLTMDSGSFTSANAEATGALRLLSLMNLAGLFQRANINQLFDPGVTFDRAMGNMEFDEGALRIPGFSVEGSGGYFTFASDIDLLTETLEGELVVTLPLVDNIPWVAALAGGLPIAAGTYVLSKVFEEQMNQLSSGVYSVSGDLNDPEVMFKRVFDAKATAPESASQSVTESSSSSPAR